MSRKGDAKKRKAKMLRNKKLIERYPWIRPVGWYLERLKTYTFTMYDDVPVGWKRAFGKIMLEDYRDVLIRNGRINAPLLTQGWIEPLCEACYNKRIDHQRR